MTLRELRLELEAWAEGDAMERTPYDMLQLVVDTLKTLEDKT